MYCIKCGNEIPEGRLKAVLGTRTCVRCSAAQRVVGFPLINCKTEYSALQLMSQSDAQRLHKMGERRGTSASTYMKREKRT